MNEKTGVRATTNRGVARLGFVVPMSNTNLEPDMYSTRPPGASVHFARAGGYDLDKVPDSEQMARFADASLEPVLRDLGAARPDVVAYGCTSATLTHGPEYDHAFCRKMQELTGVPCVTAAGALYETPFGIASELQRRRFRASILRLSRLDGRSPPAIIRVQGSARFAAAVASRAAMLEAVSSYNACACAADLRRSSIARTRMVQVVSRFVILSSSPHLTLRLGFVRAPLR